MISRDRECPTQITRQGKASTTQQFDSSFEMWRCHEDIDVRGRPRPLRQHEASHRGGLQSKKRQLMSAEELPDLREHTALRHLLRDSREILTIEKRTILRPINGQRTATKAVAEQGAHTLANGGTHHFRSQ